MNKDKMKDKFLSKTKYENGCLIWLGYRNITGYGSVYLQGKMWSAHRASFYLFKNEPLKPGYEIHHECENKICVKPSHLIQVTHSENLKRAGWGKIQNMNSNKKYCPKGHEYSKLNTIIQKNKLGGISRKCKLCQPKKYDYFITEYNMTKNFRLFMDSLNKHYIKADDFMKDMESKFGLALIKSAVKQILLLEGIDTYSSGVIQTRKYLDNAFNSNITSLDQIISYLNIKPRQTKLRKKMINI